MTGISYLSKAQESAAKVRIGNPTPGNYVVDSKVTHTVADTMFIERTKSRVKNWKNTCKNSSSRTDGKKCCRFMIHFCSFYILSFISYNKNLCSLSILQMLC